MQRVYWTLDLLEAHVIADFLRAEGIHARVFDADFVRQDWLAAIAYGGYRVVAVDEQATAACQLIAGRRANDFALDEEDAEAPACPRCGSRDTLEDPLPRRVASALLFLFMLPVVPFKWRRRCHACRNRWKAAPAHTFRDLARWADAADGTQ